MTAVIARETTRIAIGWGIISPYTRHPVQIAMEARVLQDIAGEGRFLLGLGASKIFMKEIGEGEKGKEVGPAVVMRESLEIIEAMLSGRDVQYQGKAFSAFAPPLKPDAHTARWRVPMYVGATGPVLQRLAGSHADGLLTASITTPAFIKLSREQMEEGARKAAARAVTDSILDKTCAITGTPKQCIERIEAYQAAGCTHILLELWGENRPAQARLFGEKVLPHFKKQRIAK